MHLAKATTLVDGLDADESSQDPFSKEQLESTVGEDDNLGSESGNDVGGELGSPVGFYFVSLTQLHCYRHHFILWESGNPFHHPTHPQLHPLQSVHGSQ